MIEIALKISIAQLLFLSLYILLLRRETFFEWNRVYLIFTAIISLILPFVQFNWINQNIISEASYTINEIIVFANPKNQDAITIPAKETLTQFDFKIEHFYLIGCIIFTLLFMRKLQKLNSLKRKCIGAKKNKIFEYKIPNSTVAFSFMNCLFIGENVKSNIYEVIVSHELVHIKEKHSYDLILFEILKIVLWISPFIYLYQNLISEIHEFIADRKMDKNDAHETLLQEIFDTENFSFTNNYSTKSLLKKRIKMLNKKSNNMAGFKYLLIIPCLMIVILFNGSSNAQNTSPLNDEELKNQIRKEIKSKLDQGENVLILISKDLEKHKANPKQIKSKQEYYESMILFEMMYEVGLEYGMDMKNYPEFLKNPKDYDEYVVSTKGRIKNEIQSSAIIKNKYELPKELQNQEIFPINEVDIAPLFIKCEVVNSHECFHKELNSHINQNFYYPEEAIEKGIKGRVFANIIITQDGNIVIKAIRAPDPSLENAVKEILMKIPKLYPAIHKNEKVAVNIAMPISFMLDN